MIQNHTEKIKQKAKHGVLWSFTEKAGTQILAFIIGVIMTRILLPSDYGIIALLEILVTVGLILSNFGLGQSYVINHGSDTDGSSVFITNIVISCLLYAAIFFSAPYLAGYYDIASLEYLIKVFCLNLPVQSAGMFYQFVLIRKFELKSLAVIKIISLMAAGVMGIYFAVLNYGPWALVIYFNSYYAINLILLILFSGWQPQWHFNLHYLKSQIKKSSEIASTELIDILYSNIITYFISRVYSIRITGFYSKSRTIQNSLVTSLQQIIQSVSLPLFANLSGNKDELMRVLQKQVRMLSYFSSLVFGIIFIAAEPFVAIVFTEKWLPMVPYFKLLAIVGWLIPMQYLHSMLLLTLGHSRLNLILESMKKISIIISLIFVMNMGVEYIILLQIFLLLPGLLINIVYTSRFTGYPIRQQLVDHFSSFAMILLTGAVILSVSSFIHSQFILLLLSAVGGILVYISFGYIFGISEYKQIRNIISSIRENRG